MNFEEYLEKAIKGKWAIGQFNFSTLEQLKGILAAASKNRSPAILGTSEGEYKFLGIKEIIALVELAKAACKIPVFLNLDHGKNLDLIKEAIDYGYNAVHFDGSGLSLEENIKKTKKVVAYARKKNVLVEGELGVIPGESKSQKGGLILKKENLTSPADVQKFIKTTKVDILAVSIGNVHGVYELMPKLDIGRLKEIEKITTPKGVGLVLHGGSGIPDSDIKKAIASGIVKINFNTELRMAWRGALEVYFKENPKELKPYKILPWVQNKIKEKVEEKIFLLNSKNKL